MLEAYLNAPGNSLANVYTKRPNRKEYKHTQQKLLEQTPQTVEPPEIASTQSQKKFPSYFERGISVYVQERMERNLFVTIVPAAEKSRTDSRTVGSTP